VLENKGEAFMRATFGFAGVLAFALAGFVWAEEPAVGPASPGGPADLNMAEILSKAGGLAGPLTAKSESPWPDFEKVTKDMKASEGMFTLWTYPSGAKDKDSEKLLAQIPSAMLGL
jgi:hypothetical protein